MVTRSLGIATTTQTSRLLLSKHKYLLQGLSRQCPAYYAYYDSLEIPAGATPFDVKKGVPEIHQGEVFCREKKEDGTLCGHRACRTNDLTRHLVAKHDYDLAGFRRNRKKKTPFKKAGKFYNNMMRHEEPEVESQDLEPALPSQKRKRAPSDTSEYDFIEDEDDDEAVRIAFKEARYPMSGAIPNDEVIWEPVDAYNDFIRSNAPSPSSARSIIEDPTPDRQLAAPRKKGLIYSHYKRDRLVSAVHSMLGSNFGLL